MRDGKRREGGREGEEGRSQSGEGASMSVWWMVKAGSEPSGRTLTDNKIEKAKEEGNRRERMAGGWSGQS